MTAGKLLAVVGGKMSKDIADKIKKLIALSKNNPSVEEAAAAAAKAQALIEKHHLEELLADDAAGVKELDPKIIQKVIYKFDGPYGITWIVTLAHNIGEINGVKVWYTKGIKGYKNNPACNAFINAAGTADRIDLVEDLVIWLSEEVLRLLESDTSKPQLQRGTGKHWTNGFKNGAVSRIVQRLKEAQMLSRKEMRQELDFSAYEKAGNDVEKLMALDMKPKYSLAKVDLAIEKLQEQVKKAEEWVAQNVGKLTKTTATSGSLDGYLKGHKAGGRAKLGRG